MSDDFIIRYEATVVTGLEFLAADECREKFHDDTSKVTKDHGRVYVETKRSVNEILALRGVDNVYVVIYDHKYDHTPKDKDELKQRLNEMMSQCEWKKGINVWMSAFNYDNCDIDTIFSNEKCDRKPSFRVTCNRTGDHCFTSQEAAPIFGAVINDTFHWPVTMKGFDIEVVLNIKDLRIYVSISLTRESLHKRNLISFGPTSLRATIAYNMLRLCSIQIGDIVCDAMCGSGAIPIECQFNWPQCFTLAGDNHTMAVERTQINCQEKNFRLDISQIDITALPLRSNSIDVFILDLPFGKRLGSKHDNKTLYPALLNELARCTKLKKGRAVMLTQDKRNMNYTLGYNHVKKYWKIYRTVFVKIGGLCASIYCIQRSSLEFNDK